MSAKIFWRSSREGEPLAVEASHCHVTSFDPSQSERLEPDGGVEVSHVISLDSSEERETSYITSLTRERIHPTPLSLDLIISRSKDRKGLIRDGLNLISIVCQAVPITQIRYNYSK